MNKQLEPLGVAGLLLAGAAIAVPFFGWAPFIFACVVVLGLASVLSS